MHSPATRNEFLRLRIQGLSLAKISRQLRVSKPTLIKWGRQRQTELSSATMEARHAIHLEINTAAGNELSTLTRRLNVLKQELFSRALREYSTESLKTLAGETRQRIRQIQSATSDPPLSENQNPNIPIQNSGSELIRT